MPVRLTVQRDTKLVRTDTQNSNGTKPPVLTRLKRSFSSKDNLLELWNPKRLNASEDVLEDSPDESDAEPPARTLPRVILSKDAPNLPAHLSATWVRVSPPPSPTSVYSTSPGDVARRPMTPPVSPLLPPVPDQVLQTITPAPTVTAAATKPITIAYESVSFAANPELSVVGRRVAQIRDAVNSHGDAFHLDVPANSPQGSLTSIPPDDEIAGRFSNVASSIYVPSPPLGSEPSDDGLNERHSRSTNSSEETVFELEQLPPAALAVVPEPDVSILGFAPLPVIEEAVAEEEEALAMAPICDAAKSLPVAHVATPLDLQAAARRFTQ